MTGDTFSGAPMTGQWGIFGSDGSPILTVDSVYAIEYARDYRISDYPQEMGAFESYNKVQLPFQAKVTFSIARSRRDFLGSVETATASLGLVSVITPEVSYPSANLTHYGYRRQKENAELILVDVWCEEVRITATSSLSDTQSTNGAATAVNGNVQAQSPGSPGAVSNATFAAGAQGDIGGGQSSAPAPGEQGGFSVPQPLDPPT